MLGMDINVWALEVSGTEPLSETGWSAGREHGHMTWVSLPGCASHTTMRHINDEKRKLNWNIIRQDETRKYKDRLENLIHEIDKYPRLENLNSGYARNCCLLLRVP
jgi:hypothetical protein